MRKPLLPALLLAALFAACDSTSPTGPSTVTVEALNPPSTTTTVPPGVTTTAVTSSSTTTSVPTPATTRTYVAFGPVAPTVPSQMTLFLQPLAARTVSSFLARVPFVGTMADPLEWTVTGFYVTPGGSNGQISGRLIGTFDEGSFTGTLTNQTPECTAEREFGGSLDPQFLRWSGGQTLRDCKGSPLGFNALVMLATNGPAPTTTAISTSTTTAPLQCSFSLSADGTSVDGAGGQRTVGLTTAPNCGWTVQNFVEWITVIPSAGSGSATISMTVAANPGPPRSATVVIAGLPFVVNQGLPTTTTTTSVLALADLLPVTPAANFCRYSDGALLVDVRNQGVGAAAGSVTRVFFDGGGGGQAIDRFTANLAPNTNTTLAFTIPASCLVTNCTLLITANATGVVQESNTGNNSVNATCNFAFGDARSRP